ncbi:hypothetical protein J5U46_23620 [Micromonospora tulbaghiae]|uniref:Flagellar basal body-associated protein FliL n=1 Tax=Micromonospora tulbaghiae TaxID=479978 RepID=A0AAW4JSY6_9ACTN|nr:hypothetical protein [Micromonospora tulbaghiae]MBO4143145.1 hypothetical protein [Micromonospora tulbaghiae]MDX5457913.1 hypothetical protein [Micromonospora tulbaghiae]SCE85185.1 hypothetical protein GA0070562_3440 [Micromonospora tulbaghiae]
MSQPPSSPYSGNYPSPQQQPGGYQPPQQPQYGGDYPQAPQQQYGGDYPPQQPQYGSQLGAPVPPKKSGVGKVLLIVLAVVLVLCVGGGVAAYFATKDTVDEVVTATKTRVVEPQTLGGRAKVTDPQLQSAAAQMKSELSKDVPDATSTVGAFYGDPAKKDLVMIVAVSGVMADPKKELADATAAVTPDLATKDFKTVDAGPLGGDAKCSDGKASDVPVAVCIWVDRGSLGMVVVYFKSAAELQSEFVTMRGEIEKQD